MKFYLTRPGRPDFVCIAPTAGAAMMKLWIATREIPRVTYKIHFGRRSESKVVSAAAAFWLPECDGHRTALREVLEETSDGDDFAKFLQDVIRSAELLEA